LSNRMLYAILPGESGQVQAKKSEIKIENESIKVNLASTDANLVIKSFISKTKNEKERTVLSSSPFDFDGELFRLVEDFLNSTGGSHSLLSARELNSEPKCLLSGDFLCSEVLPKNSNEVVEYFKQAMRTRESLGISTPALLSLYKNGFTLNFIINPPSANPSHHHVYSKSFLLLLSGSNLDLELFRLKNILEKSDEGRMSSRKIRQNLHLINKDLVKQTKPDLEKRDQLLKLMKTLKYIPEENQDNRINKAKQFMENREQSLKNNGLLWSLNEEYSDNNRTLSLQYQKLRIDLEEARSTLGAARQSNNKADINTALVLVRQKENLIASCEAKIANSSVVSLHHQLKASRDKLLMEQIEHLKKSKAGNKSDNEILVSHVESQKRLIERLEGDIDVIVDQHKHFLNQVKLKQLAVMHKYRGLMEGAASDRINRLESLLHETITDLVT